MPNPASAKAFDRYAYVENNPVRYNDPSGHFTSDEICRYYNYCGKDAQKQMSADLGPEVAQFMFLQDVTFGDSVFVNGVEYMFALSAYETSGGYNYVGILVANGSNGNCPGSQNGFTCTATKYGLSVIGNQDTYAVYSRSSKNFVYTAGKTIDIPTAKATYRPNIYNNWINYNFGQQTKTSIYLDLNAKNIATIALTIASLPSLRGGIEGKTGSDALKIIIGKLLTGAGIGITVFDVIASGFSDFFIQKSYPVVYYFKNPWGGMSDYTLQLTAPGRWH